MPLWRVRIRLSDDPHSRAQLDQALAGQQVKEVTFEPVDGPINDLIDDAYRAKYHGSPYLKPMIGVRARSATVKVIPRKTSVNKRGK